ncbi:MAG: hypothetical protein ACOC44_00935 [Promethearchaeia archaeon]
MSTVVCEECGYSMDNKEPGKYNCPNCNLKRRFLRFDAFCGSKPGGFHERTNK